MRNLVFLAAVTAIGAVGVQGCSGGVCSYSKQCPNDPNLTQDQIKLAEDQCNTIVNQYKGSPCYGAGESYVNCLKSNFVCDSSGKTDANLTASKRNLNCNAAQKEVLACCVKNPGAKGCS